MLKENGALRHPPPNLGYRSRPQKTDRIRYVELDCKRLRFVEQRALADQCQPDSGLCLTATSKGAQREQRALTWHEPGHAEEPARLPAGVRWWRKEIEGRTAGDHMELLFRASSGFKASTHHAAYDHNGGSRIEKIR
jgi:hypothetical protein